MNCGFILPPAAGTDLPNDPNRDPWQPFLGSVRTYVRSGEKHDFDTWKEAMTSGKVFITGGPLIQLKVNDAEPGGTVRLPVGGGEVTVKAILTSPRPLQTLDIMLKGEPIQAKTLSSHEGQIHALHMTKNVRMTESGWVAAAAKGVRSESQQIDSMAHTGAIRILVGDQPITSSYDASSLIGMLKTQKI